MFRALNLTARTFVGAQWSGLLQYCLLIIFCGILYARVLAGLGLQWMNDANYSYGFSVPLFCGWVVWRERKQLAVAPIKPSSSGLIIIFLALLQLVLGVIGAENFLARTSLLFLLAGFLVYFRGWSTFRTLLFPWATLFLMIPLPVIIFNQVALPLQFGASWLAGGLLSVLGVPVLREGNVIHLPSLTLDVVEACSGIRSLASLLTLSVFFGYLFEPRISRRVLLFLCAIPIAVVANGFRIMGSGLLGEYWNPQKAEGFFHAFSGYLIFCVSIILLILVHTLLSRFSTVRKPRVL
jgi:exosortase